jgi:RES domain-containing protein
MRVVRLCKRKYPRLDGIGACKVGGRWNSPGRHVVYTASCGALAALEYRVNARELPVNMLLLRVEVPATLDIEIIDSLPADQQVFRQLGDEWLENGGTVAMQVPSVLVPRQWNLLLNPKHPLFPAVQVLEEAPFAYDSRLLSEIPTA